MIPFSVTVEPTSFGAELTYSAPDLPSVLVGAEPRLADESDEAYFGRYAPSHFKAMLDLQHAEARMAFLLSSDGPIPVTQL